MSMRLYPWLAGVASFLLLSVGLVGAQGAVTAPHSGAVQHSPGILAPGPGHGQPRVLLLFNREVVVLRSPLGGFDIAGRVRRAQRRFADLDRAALSQPVRQSELDAEGLRGISVYVGERIIFSVLSSDLDPEERLSLQQATDVAAARLAEALDARRRQSGPEGWSAGVATTFAVLLGWSVALIFCQRLRSRWVQPVALDGSIELGAEDTTRAVVRTLLQRLGGVLIWAALSVLLFLGLLAILRAFAWTEPWSQRLGEFVYELVAWVVSGILSAVPGLSTIVAILLVSRALQDVMNLFLRKLQTGGLNVPFLHPETVGATRRLLTLLIWGLALAVAYPYLPGSDSDAFKGISVLFGAMLTLGSSGTVTQLMSGLVIIYSRSLKRGDFVSINGVEGVVSEVGTLAVKLKTMRNEEVTLPNAVIVGSPIHNYSKLAGEQGTLISTSLTIGYDTPWRQVHALLVDAARATPGVRDVPSPFVRQRALSDFYVEYELFANIDQPLERVSIMSSLHAQILDEFNRHAVQIMSPHFFNQPKQPVIVPPARWHDKPASDPGSG